MSLKIESVGISPPPRPQTSRKATTGFKSQLQTCLTTHSSTARAAEQARLQINMHRLEMTRSLCKVAGESDGDASPVTPSALGTAYPVDVDQCRGFDGAPKPVRALTEPATSTYVQRENMSSLEGLINRAAASHDVPPGLIRSVIRTESAFDPKAVSPAGAQGLMQLMPKTAAELGVTNPFDSEQNIMAGTRYLRQLLDRYDGDLDHALAAYNWGMGNVDRHGLEHMPAETRNYLERVKQA